MVRAGPTATFDGVVGSHDGEGAFGFELVFSEEFGIEAGRLAAALEVTGGEVSGVARVVEHESRRWAVTVEPAGDGPVVITLAPAPDCAVEGGAVYRRRPARSRTRCGRRCRGGPAPYVTGVVLAADASADREWTVGERIEVRLTFSEAVTVEGGTPTVGVSIGGVARTLGYVSGSGSATLAFSAAVTDADGALTRIAVTADSLALAGGRIASQATAHAAVLGHAATVASEAPDTTALTAAFVDVPTHHGGDEFTFELRFSEAPHGGFSYKTLQGTRDRSSVIAVVGGAVKRASRIEGNLRWTLRIAPDANAGDVTVTLPATTDCAATGAICTGDARALSAPASVTVPRTVPVQTTPVQTPPVSTTPLTVSFETAPPAEHDGSGAFTFRLAFSENLHQYSYTTLRDTSLTVMQGDTRLTPTKVKRTYASDASRGEPHLGRHGDAAVEGEPRHRAGAEPGLHRGGGRCAPKTGGRCRTSSRRRCSARRGSRWPMHR